MFRVVKTVEGRSPVRERMSYSFAFKASFVLYVLKDSKLSNVIGRELGEEMTSIQNKQQGVQSHTTQSTPPVTFGVNLIPFDV